MLFEVARKLRNGRLRRWGPVWTVLGKAYRTTLAVLHVNTTVSSRIGPYGPFKLDGRFAFSDFSSWGGGHNACFRPCIEACKNANVVLDVGAHVGLVSLPASEVLAPGGRVYAFEPARANRALLVRHIERNGANNIEVIAALVGATEEPAVAFFEQETDSGLNSIAENPSSSAFRSSNVRQVNLDGFCAARALVPDVMKIDVEGAEIGVLRGAASIIRSARPTIFLSVHPKQIEQLGYQMADLSALVSDLGYECRDDSGAVAALESGEFMLVPTK